MCLDSNFLKGEERKEGIIGKLPYLDLINIIRENKSRNKCYLSKSLKILIFLSLQIRGIWKKMIDLTILLFFFYQ